MPKKINKKTNDIVRSSAAEYLTFIAASGEGKKSKSYMPMRIFG